MNPIYKTITGIIVCLFSHYLYAQPGKVVKPPKINVVKVTSNAAVNAKIHANSNSVFGTAKTHPKYDKKTQAKKGEIKEEDTKKEEPKNRKGKNKKKN